jgi:hypothetical protein
MKPTAGAITLSSSTEKKIFSYLSFIAGKDKKFTDAILGKFYFTTFLFIGGVCANEDFPQRLFKQIVLNLKPVHAPAAAVGVDEQVAFSSSLKMHRLPVHVAVNKAIASLVVSKDPRQELLTSSSSAQ